MESRADGISSVTHVCHSIGDVYSLSTCVFSHKRALQPAPTIPSSQRARKGRKSEGKNGIH